MFDVLAEPLTVLPTVDLIDQVREEERQISRHRARQVELLRELSRRSESDPSISQLAGELDVAPATARELLETSRRTPELSDRFAKLESGEHTFDRAAALARLFAAGAGVETLTEAEDRDITGIHKLTSLTKRIRRRDERRAHAERHLRSWPSIDEAAGFLQAQLTATDWAVVNRALDERADRFAADPRATREQLRADALVAISRDWLEGPHFSPGRGPGPIITVMVDAEAAAATSCEAGMALTAGPRIGVDTLDRLMCEGSVELVVDPGNGQPLAVGPTHRVVPPKVRRVVLNRDGACTIDGCGGTYRLEVHHIVPRSRGGTHDLENLTTLCWWHHHVAVHGRGASIDPDSPPFRRRILPAGHDPP
ncbi:MAG: HNH endonuclease [Acidimicrobiia bacterium]|nr:HNH endonuclease [Acidimicrobiia bacterium]NNL71369.1 DUF222 domain-containing protein [Acidimicrobiia bacterium]